MGMLIHRYKGRNKTNIPASSDIEQQEYKDSDIVLETQEESDNQYTKTDINRMNTAELQAVAFNNGVDDAYEMTGSDLKKVLIDKFGL